MKNLRFQYHLTIALDQEVNHHYFSLKCYPKSEPRQTISHVKTRCNADYYSISQDSFKNKFIYGYKESDHKVLDVYVEGKATVDWEKYDESNELLTVYKLPTKYTSLEGKLKEFYEECKSKIDSSLSPLDIATKLNELIYEEMTYIKNVTTSNTTASEAFETKQGVCQDYAHIMLAILRGFDIPCRYVAGLMENEGFTHAWIEIYSNGKWYGFDPTNKLLVNDIYIAFARGRDAKDTLVNRGIYFGQCTDQVQTLDIIVEEI